jgi:hypothetical protein
MIIRQNQIQSFQKAALQNFEDQMVAHTSEFAPRHALILGEAGLREVVQLGMLRARTHGFTLRGPVRLYIELILLLGAEFDSDPQYPWARAAIDQRDTQNQMARASLLYERTMEYLVKVGGPNNEYARGAFRRLQATGLEGLVGEGPTIETSLLRGMHKAYPQKCEYVGKPALEEIIRHGTAIAKKYGASSDIETALFVAMMFAMGHGFDSDPQHPWVAKALRNPSGSDPHRVIQHLRRKAEIYLASIVSSVSE